MFRSETSTRMTRNNLSLPHLFPNIFSHYQCININSHVPNIFSSNSQLTTKAKAMTSKVVEITIISCEDLTTNSFKTRIRKNARAVIRVPHCTETRSTTLDVKGGAYPCWNEKFTMEMPAGMNWFDVEIWYGMEKVIGTARIPATDFVGGILPDGYLNFLSYRLRGRNGEFNGIVNVSVRVASGKGRKKEEEADRLGFGCGYVIGVPSGAVVTGVPVCSATKA